jgi:hypothetical protein
MRLILSHRLTHFKPSPLRYLVIAFIVVMWLYQISGMLGAELTILRRLLTSPAQSYADKKYKIDGPLYPLIQRARGVIPESSTVAFLKMSSVPRVLNYNNKARYYLYPRQVVFPRKDEVVRLSPFRQAEFFLWIVDEGQMETLNTVLDRVKPPRLIFSARAQWKGSRWVMGLHDLRESLPPE